MVGGLTGTAGNGEPIMGELPITGVGTGGGLLILGPTAPALGTTAAAGVGMRLPRPLEIALGRAVGRALRPLDRRLRPLDIALGSAVGMAVGNRELRPLDRMLAPLAMAAGTVGIGPGGGLGRAPTGMVGGFTGTAGESAPAGGIIAAAGMEPVVGTGGGTRRLIFGPGAGAVLGGDTPPSEAAVLIPAGLGGARAAASLGFEIEGVADAAVKAALKGDDVA